MRTLSLAKKVASSASKKKASNIRILDLRSLTSFTDYFIIASGSSDRQVEAIANSIVCDLKKIGRRPIGMEGTQHARWIVADYGDVVAHIFHDSLRDFYAIEKLWADAKEVKK